MANSTFTLGDVVFIVSLISGILGVIVVGGNLNPVKKLSKRIDDHEKTLEKHDERIAANKSGIKSLCSNLDNHIQVNSKESIVIIRTLKTLLDNQIVRNEEELQNASKELGNYLIERN